MVPVIVSVMLCGDGGAQTMRGQLHRRTAKPIGGPFDPAIRIVVGAKLRLQSGEKPIFVSPVAARLF